MTYSSRAVSTVGLILFNLGIVLFALIPFLPGPNPLKFVEAAIATLAGVSAGVLAAALFAYHSRLARFAYLLSGWTATLTVLGFATEPAAPMWARGIFSTLFTAGAIISFGLHLEYGGRPSVYDVEEDRRADPPC